MAKFGAARMPRERVEPSFGAPPPHEAATPPPLRSVHIIDAHRDPETARRALRIADGHLVPVNRALFQDHIDPVHFPTLRNSLALATKQLDAAQRADPTATLSTTNHAAESLVLKQSQLRAQALALEGRMVMLEGDTKGAIRLFEQAVAVEPDFAVLYHDLGQLHLAEHNKGKAIAAFQRGLALDPDNIDMLTALDHAENLSGAATAAYKFADTSATAINTTATAIRYLYLGTLALLTLLAVGGFALHGKQSTVAGPAIFFIVIILARRAILSGLVRMFGWALHAAGS